MYTVQLREEDSLTLLRILRDALLTNPEHETVIRDMAWQLADQRTFGVPATTATYVVTDGKIYATAGFSDVLLFDNLRQAVLAAETMTKAGDLKFYVEPAQHAGSPITSDVSAILLASG